MLQRGDALKGRIAVIAAPAHQNAPSDLIVAASEPHFAYEATKRVIDITLALLLLVLALPLLGLACLLILVTARSSPLLAQRRVGWLGREFRMLKLRTMRSSVDQHVDQATAILNKDRYDERITVVGRFLRRTSIDELPQLVNVLSGEMSLVGPRPGLAEEIAEYRPSWRRRLSVKPGLSGLWQVSGRSTVPATRWMAMDRYYVAKRSLGFDLAILARTVAAVLSMRGAW
jgi:lipopolysaccharide/colanic/teichoic acid biosynthesis glycosyltransferase